MTSDSRNEWVGVILAAGAGSRMRSSIPKPLHTLCGRTLLEQTMWILHKAGIERVVVVASPTLAADRRFLEIIGEVPGALATVAIQSEPRGTGDALLSASDAAGDASHILVANADMPLITAETVRTMLDTHTDSRAAITLLTGKGSAPAGFGRVRRDADGRVTEIVEEADADEATLSVNEFNAGYYCMDASLAWNVLVGLAPSPGGEIYITDAVAAAQVSGNAEATVETVLASDLSEVTGVNDRTELAAAEAALRARIRRHWMIEGVTMIDPETTYIDSSVVIGQDTTVRPNTHLLGSTTIGLGAVIGPGSVLKDTRVGDGADIVSSHVESARIGERASIGPFSHLRPGAVIGSDVHVGNYAEVKNSVVGPGAKIGHFSYVGDATIGAGANIGAGTVTCNYDGDAKHQTYVGENAFIGSGSMLVAPISIGAGASTGAGSVVTHDVPPGSRVAGVPAKPMPDTDVNTGQDTGI
ncbi:MAG: bifunctional UDP-N-acetylglucosamine diphosphorylase/glucosamine-1-phosphate N-acetyltransferase GlmU [Dehalococcoidia bacterium]|jgi:bifunctional UDP-N-acetylglucosamine pyrophosphorylase/glucosamine-1-phosphate N-acetyltransferase|nr:bifunctional UDP-N-acetylglucosamine diphosphorylase/glucosamine-1-phosphate N-acetyltransferase GlmU [Dehalococcoidia bacterium]